MTLADQSLVEDAAGELVKVSDFVSRTAADPALYGTGSARYDPALHRWLPGGVASPDGTAYAYGDDQLRVHVVDIATSQDRVIALSGSWGPVGWLPSGLYVAQVVKTQSAFAGTSYKSIGLWVVDPKSGSLRQVSSETKNWQISTQGAWGLDRPAGDPPGQGPNRLLHLALDTRKVEEWYHWPQLNAVFVEGFDSAGLPIVLAQGNSTTIWFVQASGTATTIYQVVGGLRPEPPLAVDSHGVWFSGFNVQSADGAPIWLYAAATSMRIVASKPSLALSVAGPCV